jgi:alpha-1,3-glucosyltransferase
VDDKPGNESPFTDSPLDALLTPFRPSGTQWVARYMIVAFAVLIRLAVGLGPYSGYKSEPMHGDFEAQRHWMEITVHLPLKEWYYHDLEWWGLDYPPLTAYHSWFLGKLGSLLDKSWFELYTSRGVDDYDLKSYMRATVVLSELVVYIPAVLWFVRWNGKHHKISPVGQSMAATAVLFQPALILVDHGHFQYNAVMLGFALLAIVNLAIRNRYMGSVMFVLSVCFKQMALYYAPIIFAFLLGECVFPRINLPRLVAIGGVVFVTFILMFGPLVLAGGFPLVGQALNRIFPFARGLWEDKVANFWCTANTIIKFKNIYSVQQLQRYSLAATLISILPAMAVVFFYPKSHLLPWAFSAGAWGFFLFSFQVHEKTVLVPLMPATLLLCSSDPNIVSVVVWINNIAMFSMWPLLRREGLTLQYAVVVFCWNWLIGQFSWTGMSKFLPKNWFVRLAVLGSYSALIGLHLVEYFVPSSWGLVDKYPDFFVLANVTVSFGCFVVFWLWTLYNLFMAARH